jgi:hypothetical protein
MASSAYSTWNSRPWQKKIKNQLKNTHKKQTKMQKKHAKKHPKKHGSTNNYRKRNPAKVKNEKKK